jgi:hypothetical protein
MSKRNPIEKQTIDIMAKIWAEPIINPCQVISDIGTKKINFDLDKLIASLIKIRDITSTTLHRLQVLKE